MGKFIPLYDRITVRRTEAPTMTASGLHIPDKAQTNLQEGKIIAVGHGKILENGAIRPLELKAGDYVLFGLYSGTEIEVDGERLLFMREEEVLGRLEGGAKVKEVIKEDVIKQTVHA